jgi:hypothetical protein
MREIVFALEFKGTAGPVTGGGNLRRARTTASSQTMSTVLSGDGVRARVDPAPGDTAILESRVERFDDGSFVESGTITYGAAGSIVFETIGRGWVGPTPNGSGVVGGVLWRVREGTGRLAGAQGLIVSNFTVTPTGEVTDNHFARLYVPPPDQDGHVASQMPRPKPP